MLEEAYFRLDRARFPNHEQQLRNRIEALGGFDSISPETVTPENMFQTGWRRFWGVIFDVIIFSAVMLPLVGFIQNGREDDLAFLTALEFSTALVSIFYYIIMHAACGQTLGKMITGVKVVRNNDLKPIGFRHALMRDIVPLLFVATSIVMLNSIDIVVAEDKDAPLQVPLLVVGFAIVEFLWPLLELITMLFNRRRRAIHDFIAGTVVTRYLRRPAARQPSIAPTLSSSAA